MFAGVESLFSWNNEISGALETGVLFKTNQDKLARAISRLAELHPYEEPAIVGWNCDAASIGTANWLKGIGA